MRVLSKAAKVLIDMQNEEAEEVMVAFGDAGSEADTADWLARYPAHSRLIARLAADRWAGESEGEVPVTAENAAAVARIATLAQEAREIVRAQRAAATVATASTVAALSGLIAPAKAQGLDPRALAAKLNIPFTCVMKLHRRLIVPASVPASLVRSLAEAIGRTADDVAAYLRMPPTLAVGASYRSDGTPTVAEQESFAAALAADSTATDEQRAHWSSAE